MTYQVLLGDARARLRDLADQSVHCVVTSPPYFGLRDYGTATWDGGDDASCDHLAPAPGPTSNKGNNGKIGTPYRATCGKCGATRRDDQVGLELSVGDYVAALVSVFTEARRVLRDDGTLWLNLGDSYCGGGGFAPDAPINVARALAVADGITSDRGFGISARLFERNVSGGIKRGAGLKAKDLVGAPWLVASALRDAGWWLRAGIVWHKPNAMPEPVTDRVTTAHEYVFHLAKSARYYYDGDAIRTPYTAATLDQIADGPYQGDDRKDYDRAEGVQRPGDIKRRVTSLSAEAIARGANARSVWSISPEPSALPHFAIMPRALARKCIRTGCPPGGTVLDPFAGVGTTLVVALEEGRNAIGVELNPAYHAIARARCADVAPLFAAELPELAERVP